MADGERAPQVEAAPPARPALQDQHAHVAARREHEMERVVVGPARSGAVAHRRARASSAGSGKGSKVTVAEVLAAEARALLPHHAAVHLERDVERLAPPACPCSRGARPRSPARAPPRSPAQVHAGDGEVGAPRGSDTSIQVSVAPGGQADVVRAVPARLLEVGDEDDLAAAGAATPPASPGPLRSAGA